MCWLHCKITGLAVFFAAMVTHAGAQGLSIELDGGLQGSQYQEKSGQNTMLPGGSFGLLYTFRLGRNWGLLSGLKGGVYRTQATLPDGVVYSSYQVDDAGSAFQYSMQTRGFKETQQFFAAGIPLILQYHTAGAGTQWYLNGGGEVLLPSGNTINMSAQQVILSGYYPDYNLHISNLPQHGFGTFNNWKASAGSVLKPAASLNAATGVSFKLSGRTRLYTGVYVEYGLTDLRSRNDTLPLVTYSPSGVNGAQINSVLNTKNVGQVTPISFGLQVRLSFGNGREKAAVRPRENQGLQNPADSVLSDDDILFIEKSIVFGAIGEISIPDVQKTHLDGVAAIMMKYPAIHISIVGHICNSVTETEDPKVGIARARAVADYLHGKGIAHGRMDVSAMSESDPVQPIKPGVNFQNRRAAITVQ